MKGADTEIYLLLSTEELSSGLEAVISRLEHIFYCEVNDEYSSANE
jgi:hypothetical protein